MTEVVQGLDAIADRYDGFVFDQYGVLHDGNHLYPNVVAVLRGLRERGKPALVLTNSGRGAGYNLRRLSGLGLHENLIDHVVTSGDVAKYHLLPRTIQDVGPNCYCIASDDSERRDLFLSVDGLIEADSPDQCDFVYLSGMAAGLAETWQSDLLPALLAANVPLLCSNPDYVAPGKAGLTTSPGTIAKAYRDGGGTGELVGKPYPLIYDLVRTRLDGMKCRNPLFIGDSYDHDIVGAHNAGFDALLVLSGIHREFFEDHDIKQTAVDELIKGGPPPTWISRTL